MNKIQVYLASDLWELAKDQSERHINFHHDKKLKAGEWYAISKDNILYRDSFWTKRQWALFYKGITK